MNYIIAELFFTFNDFMYTANEGDGLVDNLVFVEKQDGRASEQFLPVDVSLQFISASGTHLVCTIMRTKLGGSYPIKRLLKQILT